MNIIDISRDALKTEIYPGDPLPHAEFVSRIGENSSCNLSTLFSCVHTGTHADAPLHGSAQRPLRRQQRGNQSSLGETS